MSMSVRTRRKQTAPACGATPSNVAFGSIPPRRTARRLRPNPVADRRQDEVTAFERACGELFVEHGPGDEDLLLGGEERLHQRFVAAGPPGGAAGREAPRRAA